MKAIRLHAARDIRFDEVDAPGAPGSRQLLVAPLWAGICGSDLRGYAGRNPGRFGRIVGHEFSARVVGVGSEVSSVNVGDRVSVMPTSYCFRCDACLLGDHEWCTRQSMAGLHGEDWKWGGLGDLAIVDDYQAFPLAGIPDDEGAVVEPAAVAVTAVSKAGVRAGDTAAVVGCGPIGSLVTLALRAFGAQVVMATDPNDYRASVVRSFGAGEVVVSGTSDSELDELAATIAARRVDFVFDCAGADGTLNLAIKSVRPGGTVVVVAGGVGDKVIDAQAIQHKPISLVGTSAYTLDTWHRTMALMQAGQLSVSQLITSRIERERIVPDGYEALLDPTTRELKILVAVDGKGR